MKLRNYFAEEKRNVIEFKIVSLYEQKKMFVDDG
jgi:hypothetical protein